MAFNGVTKSASKVTKQDYMNLLYTDSDSDHVPDLKLPPVKGKKRRKKSSTSVSKDDGTCDFVCVFKTILVLLICVTLVILSGLCIWTLQRVSDLQEQVRTLQNSDQGKHDLSLLQTQVKGIDESLKELKKSDGVIENLKSQVSSFGGKLRKVEAAARKLNESVASAQTLSNTPKLMQSMTTALANLRDTQRSQGDRLSALESQAPQNGGNEKKNSVDAQFGDMLSQQIADVNETANSRIISVKEELQQFQGRLSAFESYAKLKDSSMGHDEVEALVMALIQEKLTNLTLSPVIAPNGASTNGSSDEMSRLSEKVNQLTQIMDSKTDFAESMDLVSKGDFFVFKGNTLMNFENINKTVFAINAELDSLLQRLAPLEAAVLNVSALVTNGNEATNQDQDDKFAGPESTKDSTTVPSIKESLSTTDSSRDGETTSPMNLEEIEQELGQELHIEGINTVEDLRKAYHEQWSQDNGQIDTDVVLSLLQNNSADISKRLQTFDTNSDGRFTEEELQNALGLQETISPRRCIGFMMCFIARHFWNKAQEISFRT